MNMVNILTRELFPNRVDMDYELPLGGFDDSNNVNLTYLTIVLDGFCPVDPPHGICL
jgi:hypothetical protein